MIRALNVAPMDNLEMISVKNEFHQSEWIFDTELTKGKTTYSRIRQLKALRIVLFQRLSVNLLGELCDHLEDRNVSYIIQNLDWYDELNRENYNALEQIGKNSVIARVKGVRSHVLAPSWMELVGRRCPNVEFIMDEGAIYRNYSTLSKHDDRLGLGEGDHADKD